MYNIPQEMIDEFNEKMKHISENQWRKKTLILRWMM